jgi:hypothetical protein
VARRLTALPHGGLFLFAFSVCYVEIRRNAIRTLRCWRILQYECRFYVFLRRIMSWIVVAALISDAVLPLRCCY